MDRPSDKKKKRIAEDLKEFTNDAKPLSRKLGMEPRDTDYWVVDSDEMDEIAAYGGFQERYPHWRWAIRWLQQKGNAGHIYEMVINDDPASAFVQEANSRVDQKTVITHVEGHSDFFENNNWFDSSESRNAAKMMSRHRDQYIEWEKNEEIDNKLLAEIADIMYSLEDNINPVFSLKRVDKERDEKEGCENPDPIKTLEEKGFSEDIIDDIESSLDDLLEDRDKKEAKDDFEPEQDLMKVIKDHGMRYDEEKGRAVEMEDEFKELIQMMRQEAYYLAPQKLTKTMNEGWAAYWQDKMMVEEMMLDVEEVDAYSKHKSGVLSMRRRMYNPYRVGLDLWNYIENKTNRDEVFKKLLQTEVEKDGEKTKITPDNYKDLVDFDEVLEELSPDSLVESVSQHTYDELLEKESEKIDHEMVEEMRERDESLSEKPWKALTFEGHAERHYSLVKLQNLGFLKEIKDSEVEELDRFEVPEEARYSSIKEAMEDVDYAAGWKKMREIMQSYSDIGFINEFATQEFVDRYKYAVTEEYGHKNPEIPSVDIVESWDVEDVKKKLLKERTSFGKPSIFALDTNYANQGELLLAEDYQGIEMDLEEAKEKNEQLFKVYGRPINLVLTQKEWNDEDYLQHESILVKDSMKIMEDPDHQVTLSRPRPPEKVVKIRYNGEEHEKRELKDKEIERLGLEDFVETDYPYSCLDEDEVVQY